MSEDLFDERPETPCPEPPPYHVESRDCQHGWISLAESGPIWLLCDCEDPANPWPPRKPTDGPVDCYCYYCGGKTRQDRGRAKCEYEDHHCDYCHSLRQCTAAACVEER